MISDPFAKKLLQTLKEKFLEAAGSPPGSSKNFYKKNKTLIDFLTSNREELLIIFKGAQGTKLEYYTDGFANSLTVFAQNYRKSVTKKTTPLSKIHSAMIKQIYRSLISNITTLLHTNSDTNSISEGLHALLDYHFFGIGKLLLPEE